jgi:hypothetical protein
MTAHRYHSTGKGQSATTWSCGSSSLRVDPTAKANTPSRKVSTRIVSVVTIAQHVHSYVFADDDTIAEVRQQDAYINGVPKWWPTFNQDHNPYRQQYLSQVNRQLLSNALPSCSRRHIGRFGVLYDSRTRPWARSATIDSTRRSSTDPMAQDDFGRAWTGWPG